MPVLNLALQNVALECSQISPQMESLIKSKNTVFNVRLTVQHFPQLKTESMEKVVNLVNTRFQRMQLKGTGLTTYNLPRCS